MRTRSRFMRFIVTFCLASSGVLGLAVPAQAQIPSNVRVVDQSAPGDPCGIGGVGACWENAYTELQGALDAMDPEGNPPVNEIWVAAGQYKPTNPLDPDDRTATYNLIDGVAIYGGFAGNESLLSERDPVANDTRLVGSFDPGPPGFGLDDPNRRYHVVTATDVAPPTRLDGFLIENGRADGMGVDQKIGGGLLIKNANPLIVRCRFWHNKASTGGGAIYFVPPPSDPILEIINCSFFDNLGDVNRSGGAIYNQAGRLGLTNCVFTGNKVESPPAPNLGLAVAYVQVGLVQ